jgi:hypothetical protein
MFLKMMFLKGNEMLRHLRLFCLLFALFPCGMVHCTGFSRNFGSVQVPGKLISA